MKKHRKQFLHLLNLVYLEFKELNPDQKTYAQHMIFLLLQKMMRHENPQRQKLSELEAELGGNTASNSASNAKKARSSLVRKSNAASPQAPIKTVKTTKKNELRRN